MHGRQVAIKNLCAVCDTCNVTVVPIGFSPHEPARIRVLFKIVPWTPAVRPHRNAFLSFVYNMYPVDPDSYTVLVRGVADLYS